MKSTTETTEEWYRRYYQEKGADRNDLLNNPEVLFQYLALEASLITSLRQIRGLDRADARVLDVGCGAGSGLAKLIELGFAPENLAGVDIQGARIALARDRRPRIRFATVGARALPFAAGEFDVVMESTMFIQLTDPDLARQIAAEMVRVTKPNGHVLLVDWRYARPGDKHSSPVSAKRIRALFPELRRIHVASGALAPPVGRFISKRCPSVYFLIQSFVPVLVAQHATLLRSR